jgi:hypothetical protein
MSTESIHSLPEVRGLMPIGKRPEEEDEQAQRRRKRRKKDDPKDKNGSGEAVEDLIDHRLELLDDTDPAILDSEEDDPDSSPGSQLDIVI